jgi:hypothetical protein
MALGVGALLDKRLTAPPPKRYPLQARSVNAQASFDGVAVPLSLVEVYPDAATTPFFNANDGVGIVQ